MGRFRHDNVIIVLASNVVDVKIPAIWVDAISIEREHGDSADEIESLEDIQLCGCIDLNVDIVDHDID
jgi:hypothetical protein